MVYMLRTRHLQLVALLGGFETFRRWTEWEEGKLGHQEHALKEMQRPGLFLSPLVSLLLHATNVLHSHRF